MQAAVAALKEQASSFTEQITDRIVAAQIPSYASFSREDVKKGVRGSLQALYADLEQGVVENYARYWRSVGRARASHASLDDILQAWNIASEVMNEYFNEHFADDSETRAWWFYRWQTIILPSLMSLAQVFVAAREEQIREQALRLRELSTPIIPVHQGILVLPLVGAIDEARAGQIMVALLDAVSRHGTGVVIVDITGVPVVDTNVANYLLQAARAARLLGAEVLLVGASPEIAQTIVQLGVALEGLTTLADLQSGISYALSLRGLAILPAR